MDEIKIAQVTDDGSYFVTYRDDGYIICKVSDHGDLLGKIILSGYPNLTDPIITHEGDIYFREIKHGFLEEDYDEPFRIYKVDFDWGSLNTT